MSFILEKEPKLVWKHFDDIRKIPRCSKHEDKIREHVVDFAQKRGLEHQVDDAGNVVIRKPATEGMEAKPIVILQGHMDMVCEKNDDKDHDFSKDPIELKEDGDWLTADGTTLGADNGIGIAMGLAVLDDEDMKHGPLEILLTVDEETGLTGAFAMAPDLLKGRKMLNLDSEEMDAIFVGCAGGGDSVIRFDYKRKSIPRGYDLLELKVGGLRGGHSGIDINNGRGNAIKILARLMFEALPIRKFYIARIKGGNLRNAIPREASAILAIKEKYMSTTVDQFNQSAEAILKEIEDEDPDFNIKTNEVKDDKPGKVLSTSSTKDLINMLVALPHGVQEMDHDIPELVQTSCNLAVIETIEDEKEIMIQMSSRSSIDTALQATRDQIKGVANLVDADVREPDAYPGWKPNMDSEILAITKKVYGEIRGKEPELLAIHAGLETGIIGEKFPGMDMVSIGPDIEHPHSPDERINIPSVAEIYKIVKGILEEV